MTDSKLSKLTMKHNFKFLGQKWKFLKKELENEIANRDDHAYGKDKVMAEIARLEKNTVDQRILANTEQEVANLLGLSSIDANDDDEFDEIDAAEAMDVMRNNTTLPPITSAPDALKSNSIYQGSSSLYRPSQSVTSGSSYISSKSYLTEYDADALRESIRNIKMYYTQKQMNRVYDTVPVKNVQLNHQVYCNPVEDSNTAGNGNNHSNKPVLKMISPRNNPNMTGKMSPRGMGQPLPPSGKKLSQLPPQSHRKQYSTINPEASAPIPVIIIPTSDDKLFGYEIPGNQTEQEIASIARLKALADQIGPTEIGKQFKKYALETDVRVPICVQHASNI